jgi:peptidoglycan hydrolase-like protein with peptidoglycan-binding domain
MTERFLKQIIYSILTLFLIFFIGFGVFKIFQSKPSCFDGVKNNGETGVDCGGPCQSCEIKTLSALEYNENASALLQQNNYFIYNRVTNMNDGWGAKEFLYTFYFVTITEDRGKVKENVVKKIEGKNYILPNQVKYIVDIIEKPDFKFDKIVFKIDNEKVSWSKPLSNDFIEANLFSISNVVLKTGSGEIVTETTKPSNMVYNFNRDLKRGDQGEDVFNLQSILAQDSTVYPEGVVNGVFDLATYKAVIRFQRVINIYPQTGIVDYNTREYLNQSYGGQTQSVASVSGFSFDRNLSFGDNGSDVSELQRVLKEYPSFYPEGRISGTFDYLLKRALERFQENYGLQVTGEFDTPTRTQLNLLLNKNIEQGDIPPGVTANLDFNIFNNTNVAWKKVDVIGFLCDGNNAVVAISQTNTSVMAKGNKNINLSWTNRMDKNISICPGGLQVYTNVFDKSNID